MKITFVRHTSVDIEPGTCYGRTDVALKNTFPSEAEKVKQKLRDKISLIGEDFDAVYCSPLSRCKLLADTCGYSCAIPDSRLLEMNFGDWELKKFDDIKDPKLQEWFDDWFNVSPPGGESFLDQNRRVKSFLDDLMISKNKNILIFTHAGVIMNAMLILNLADIKSLFSHQPPYGGFLEVEI